MNMLKILFMNIFLVFHIISAVYSDHNYADESFEKDDFDQDYSYGSESRKSAYNYGNYTTEKYDDDGEDYIYRYKSKKYILLGPLNQSLPYARAQWIRQPCGDMNNCPLKKRLKRRAIKRRNNKLQSEACSQCGITFARTMSRKVINGRPVTPGFKYPWIVPLMKDNIISCGGALISATFVMTASHCVYNKQMSQYPECQGNNSPSFCYLHPLELRVGILGPNFESPYESVSVRRIIPHPQYQDTATMHDVALLQLASPVTCGATVMPVCLPPSDFHQIGTKLITAGFGFNTPQGPVGPQMLREGVVTEVDPQRCLRPDQPRDFYTNLVCAAGMESGQSSCYGDSGSSLFGKFGNKFYAVGIVSYSTIPTCSPENPVTYHRVYADLNFIKQHVYDLPQA